MQVPYKCYHTGEYRELSGRALEEQVRGGRRLFQGRSSRLCLGRLDAPAVLHVES